MATSGRVDQLSVVDLFAGCGGLSLGFSWAGFDVVGSIERDPAAARTHYANFHGELDPSRRYEKDILEVDPEKWLKEELKGRRPDVVVGGPPCQAFARIGRAKLRAEAVRHGSESAHVAHLEDSRASLSQRYLDFVEVLKPRALLMENVPDIINHGGVNVAEVIRDRLAKLGYDAEYTLLNAVDFGVPQFRERMILVAFRHDQRLDRSRSEWIPEASHRADVPRGYSGTRGVAAKASRNLRAPGFVDRFELRKGLFGGAGGRADEPAITVQQAFSGLPEVGARELGRGVRKLQPSGSDPAYCPGAVSGYVNLLRSKKRPLGGGEPDSISAHVTRHLPRDFDIFKKMKQGQDYVGGGEIRSGEFARSVQEIAEGLGKHIPYASDKFPNKWWRLRGDKPSRTLTAHMGKDTYSHIHHEEARTITVREAARLQSFPDSFRFECAMNAGFRMIGNAVPPLLAEALARQIRSILVRPVHCSRPRAKREASASV